MKLRAHETLPPFAKAALQFQFWHKQVQPHLNQLATLPNVFVLSALSKQAFAFLIYIIVGN